MYRSILDPGVSKLMYRSILDPGVSELMYGSILDPGVSEHCTGVYWIPWYWTNGRTGVYRISVYQN